MPNFKQKLLFKNALFCEILCEGNNLMNIWFKIITKGTHTLLFNTTENTSIMLQKTSFNIYNVT